MLIARALGADGSCVSRTPSLGSTIERKRVVGFKLVQVHRQLTDTLPTFVLSRLATESPPSVGPARWCRVAPCITSCSMIHGMQPCTLVPTAHIVRGLELGGSESCGSRRNQRRRGHSATGCPRGSGRSFAAGSRSEGGGGAAAAAGGAAAGRAGGRGSCDADAAAPAAMRLVAQPCCNKARRPNKRRRMF